jgi:FKBP-type peptidyl-prolyl cis-trans isomerase FklB
MNKTVQLLIVGFTIILSSCSNNATDKTPETEIEKASYSLGVNMATGVKSQGFDSLDLNALSKAFTDVYQENDLDISEEDGMKLLQEYFGKLQIAAQKKEADEREAALTTEERAKKDANIQAAGAYLAENAAKKGVITTASGLQYEIINSGSGAKPTTADQVTVHYHGMLTDGTVFDSSVDRGQPTTFGVTQVIKGWTEALQLMSVGDKWKLTIPSNLAYGDQSPSAAIGPASTLIFEVELLGIN